MSFKYAANAAIYRRDHVPKKKKKGKPAGPVRHLFTSKRVEDKKFFNSIEWRQARYFTLRKYGRTCMLCGTIGGEVHVDHIKPRCKYPELALNPNNLQVLCKDCNLGKSWFFETDDWRIKS